VKTKTVSILGIVFLFGRMAFAQDSPKAEITGFYSYFRFNQWNPQQPFAACAGRLRAYPVWQRIYLGKPESEQLPLPGGHSIPVLTTT